MMRPDKRDAHLSFRDRSNSVCESFLYILTNIVVKIANIKLHYPGLRPEYERELIMMLNRKC